MVGVMVGVRDGARDWGGVPVTQAVTENGKSRKGSRKKIAASAKSAQNGRARKIEIIESNRKNSIRLESVTKIESWGQCWSYTCHNTWRYTWLYLGYTWVILGVILAVRLGVRLVVRLVVILGYTWVILGGYTWYNTCS